MSARLRAAIAMAVGTALVASLSVTSSLAAWTDGEFVRAASVGTLNCASAAPVNSTSWARVLSDNVLSSNLDAVAALNGITVSNIKPAMTSSATGVTSPTSLGSDAWSSPLDLSAVSVPVSAGVSYPIGTSTGTYTQYGRDTSAGLSVGASGAVTSGAGGAVALETPAAATPREADLKLSNTLDGILPAAGSSVANLGDVHLKVGAVGALASYDSCSVLWAGSSALAGSLTRNYLVNGLKLELTSQVVKTLGTSTSTALTNLESTLNAIYAPGTAVSPSVVQSTFNTLFPTTGMGGGAVTTGPITSLNVGVVTSLAPVRALLSTPLTDGVVTADLSTGKVTADLAALFGETYGTSGLNGLSPNTSVLTPAVLNDLSSRLNTVLQSFAGSGGALSNAITKAINDSAVTVAVTGQVSVGGVAGFTYNATITGTPGGFTGVAGYTPPTVVVGTVSAPATLVGTVLTVLLALLGLTSVNQILSSLTTAIVGPLTTALIPAIGSNVLAPIRSNSAISSLLSTVTTSYIPTAISSLGPVLGTLRTLVNVTINARPDQANPVGYPAASAAGRYFVSAMKVAVVNSASTAVVGLYLASASVGPNTVR